MKQSFSDGLDRITVIGNTVRLDFVSFSATETDTKGNPKATFSQRIVMPMDGFLRSAEKIREGTQTLSKLAQGTPAAKTVAQPAKGEPASSTQAADLPSPKSKPGDTRAKRPFP
jgi:hypothetical protein